MTGAPRAALAAAAAALAIGISACGGDDDELGADEYRSQLDAACSELNDTLISLPLAQREEDLSIVEVQERANEASAAYFETVAGLRAPDELKDAHADLLAIGDQGAPDPSDLDEMQSVTQEALDIYERLGAEGCAESQRRALESFEGG